MADQTLVASEPVELTPSRRTLESNARALAAHSPHYAQELLDTPARADVRVFLAPDGGAFARVGSGPDRLLLASARRPLGEGRALGDRLDASKVGCAVVLGFGVGHHVRALVERTRGGVLVLVYEPDVAMLRTILERVDLSAWLGDRAMRFLSDEQDAVAITNATARAEALLSLGTQLVTHPASVRRLGERAAILGATVARVVKAVRTNVVTTLVQVEATLRNLLQNADHYATASGIEELRGRGAGRPAIVVSAGPSLERNVALLSRPGVRERVVIIAVQTVLKTLLSRGIRPHFVTALDYHEISRRFYEGLTREDLAGITLVVEPKANPAILEAYDGSIRCVRDDVLDRVLGAALARPMGDLPSGATVAHLAYSFGRFLGCDPVVLVGQDLGFTDGQYYSSGAAIHDVWGPELGGFHTLENLEWQRIVRMRGLLRRGEDHLGRPIYTDEQMATYLVQFEREFAEDRARGRSTIDATEGGIRKAHTEPRPLAEVLASWEGLPPMGGFPVPDPDHRAQNSSRLTRARARLRELSRDVRRLVAIAGESRATLERLRECQRDQRRAGRLIDELNRRQKEVDSLGEAYWLVDFLNQTGSFRRFRADREISLDPSLTDVERQRRQIERDIANIEWLGDAGRATVRLLEDSLASFGGRAKVTRDLAEGEAGAPVLHDRRVVGVMVADLDAGGLGTPRDLGAPALDGRDVFHATLDRLEQVRGLAGILVATPHPDRVRALLGDRRCATPLHVEPIDPSRWREWQSLARAARLWARSSWRGGLCGWSCYDEIFDATSIAPLLSRHELDAALVVGPDWPLLDPALCREVLERYLADPQRRRLTFSQAPPGLAGVVVDRGLVEEFASHPSAFATIGGLLGYVPTAPQADPITKPACVQVPGTLRGVQRRLIADGPDALEDVRRWLAGGASGVPTLGPLRPGFPWELRLALQGPGAQPIDRGLLETVLHECAGHAGAALSLRAGWLDDASTPGTIRHAVELARGVGVAGVHLRVVGGVSVEQLASLARLPLDVLSVDVPTPTPDGSREAFARTCESLDALFHARRERGLPDLQLPWIVPRLTRRDSAYAEIEGFYDRALLCFGHAVLDPLEEAVPGERIMPLPPSAGTRDRFERTIASLDADGTLRSWSGRELGQASISPVRTLWRDHLDALGGEAT